MDNNMDDSKIDYWVHLCADNRSETWCLHVEELLLDIYGVTLADDIDIVNKEELILELDMFSGSEHRYKYMYLTLTDGIKYLVDKTQAHWLLDLIESYQYKLKDKPFQIWNLTVNKNQTAVVTMKEDSNKPIVVKQKIAYTDFPLNEIEFYCIDGVMLLKSEY